MQQVSQHGQLDSGHVAFTGRIGAAGSLVLVLVDGFFQLGAQRGIALVLKEPTDRVPQSAAATARVRVSDLGGVAFFGFGHSPGFQSLIMWNGRYMG